MTKEHDRSDTWVAGHWRGDTWIEEHYRHGTTVGEYETPTHDWSIHDSGHILTHATTCWWCGEPVFFYRDENGGCVLFDPPLGAPWKIHACWEDHMNQKELYSGVESELNDLGYNGEFYEIDGERVTEPDGDAFQISRSGFVSNNYYFYEEVEYEVFHSHKRASTVKLIVLEVFDGNQIYPFLIPEKDAGDYPDYSFVEIYGTWFKNKEEWYLLTTYIKKVAPSIENSTLIHLLSAEGFCFSCGQVIKTNDPWGLDNDGFQECSSCGEMRGQKSRTDFLQHIFSVAEYQITLLKMLNT